MHNRKPIFVSSDALLPGDILVFPASQHASWGQRLGLSVLYFFQSLVSQKHGHYDTVHTAICVANAGVPVTAHIFDDGYKKIHGHLQGPFWVYRPKDAAVANRMAAIAYESEALRWSLWEALKTAFVRSNHKDPIKKAIPSHSTMCSKFIVEVAQQAAQTSYPDFVQNERAIEQYYPAIRTLSSPKTVESYLYQNENYQLMCYPGENALEALRAEMKKEIARIGKRQDKLSQAKFMEVTHHFQTAEKKLKRMSANNFDKALLLTKVMLPHLSVKTGFSLGEARSYSNVLVAARKLGIFKRDFEHVSLKKYEKVRRVRNRVR